MQTRASASLLALIAGTALAQPPAQREPAPPRVALPGIAYDAPFFPGASYDPAVPTPDSLLGFRLGDKPVSPAQVEAVVKAIAQASPKRTRLWEYARTHEGRPLYNLLIASEANLARLDDLRRQWAGLAEPTGKVAVPADLPALAWMAYCIHGDEMSGTDASLALAHHLAASKDQDVTDLLSRVVVVIDPLMNPDGRERSVVDALRARSVQPSVDDQAFPHAQAWPSGRMNHYLFDMNRDWIFGTQPETRGRIREVAAWHPQYLMESHEMGSQDTFLFMPAREAINPNAAPHVMKWEAEFARDMGRSLDGKGWRYFTGEWNDNWYPGYTSSWAGLRGIVDNLYEQANITTDGVRKADGRIETYREAVHRQLVASVTNLKSLAANRQALLEDYAADRAASADPAGEYAKRWYAFPPEGNVFRRDRLVQALKLQGIRVLESTAALDAKGVDRFGREVSRSLPAGTVLVPGNQPLARLVAALLEFDPRMKSEVLTDERRDLLQLGRSRIYDVTAWNLAMMMDVPALTLTAAPPAASTRPLPEPRETKLIAPAASTVGYAALGTDDRCLTFAAALLQQGVRVRALDKDTRLGSLDVPRGSILVLAQDNQGATDLASTVAAAANTAGVPAAALPAGLGEGDLPDLGGEHAVLLEAPRVAVFGHGSTSPYSYGQIWHLLDRDLALRASYLDAESLAGADLRRYNVIVLPDGISDFSGPMKSLDAWVQSGGTLIAIGSAAGALAKDGGLGATRTLPAALDKVDEHRLTLAREWEAHHSVIDEAAIWNPVVAPSITYPWTVAEEKTPDEEAKRRDAWRAIFSPLGVALAARADDRHYLTCGIAGEFPVMYGGDVVLWTKAPAQAPVRLGIFEPKPAELAKPDAATKPEAKDAKPDAKPAEKSDDKAESKEDKKPSWTNAPPGMQVRLRLSGLLWPEAADRLANAAYLAREQVGAGQIILFASDPTQRGVALGTTRLFSNAVILGPGMGAAQPIKP